MTGARNLEEGEHSNMPDAARGTGAQPVTATRGPVDSWYCP